MLPDQTYVDVLVPVLENFIQQMVGVRDAQGGSVVWGTPTRSMVGGLARDEPGQSARALFQAVEPVQEVLSERFPAPKKRRVEDREVLARDERGREAGGDRHEGGGMELCYSEEFPELAGFMEHVEQGKRVGVLRVAATRLDVMLGVVGGPLPSQDGEEGQEVVLASHVSTCLFDTLMGRLGASREEFMAGRNTKHLGVLVNWAAAAVAAAGSKSGGGLSGGMAAVVSGGGGVAPAKQRVVTTTADTPLDGVTRRLLESGGSGEVGGWTAESRVSDLRAALQADSVARMFVTNFAGEKSQPEAVDLVKGMQAAAVAEMRRELRDMMGSQDPVMACKILDRHLEHVRSGQVDKVYDLFFDKVFEVAVFSRRWKGFCVAYAVAHPVEKVRDMDWILERILEVMPEERSQVGSVVRKLIQPFLREVAHGWGDFRMAAAAPRPKLRSVWEAPFVQALLQDARTMKVVARQMGGRGAGATGAGQPGGGKGSGAKGGRGVGKERTFPDLGAARRAFHMEFNRRAVGQKKFCADFNLRGQCSGQPPATCIKHQELHEVPEQGTFSRAQFRFPGSPPCEWDEGGSSVSVGGAQRGEVGAQGAVRSELEVMAGVSEAELDLVADGMFGRNRAVGERPEVAKWTRFPVANVPVEEKAKDGMARQEWQGELPIE